MRLILLHLVLLFHLLIGHVCNSFIVNRLGAISWKVPLQVKALPTDTITASGASTATGTVTASVPGAITATATVTDTASLPTTGSNNNQCFVIMSNIQSGGNIGHICRNCLAFNVSEVIITGRKNFKTKMLHTTRARCYQQTLMSN